MVKHTETLRGKGFVISKSGRTPVEYELRVFQDQINAGNFQNPGATIPGLKTIQGWVRPVVGFGESQNSLFFGTGFFVAISFVFFGADERT